MGDNFKIQELIRAKRERQSAHGLVLLAERKFLALPGEEKVVDLSISNEQTRLRKDFVTNLLGAACHLETDEVESFSYYLQTALATSDLAALEGAQSDWLEAVRSI